MRGQVATCPYECGSSVKLPAAAYTFFMLRPDRKLNRLHGFDYSSNALDFVKSCVQDKACVFGRVANNEMQLNKYGSIAERQWYWLAEQYPYIMLHAFVAMPNHIHGIIEIDRELAVGTGGEMAAQKVKSLSELVGVYKTTTSKRIHLAGFPEFAWQRSFHNHIIRYERAYVQIKNYIQENPARWQEDMFYK